MSRFVSQLMHFSKPCKCNGESNDKAICCDFGMAWDGDHYKKRSLQSVILPLDFYLRIWRVGSDPGYPMIIPIGFKDVCPGLRWAEDTWGHMACPRASLAADKIMQFASVIRNCKINIHRIHTLRFDLLPVATCCDFWLWKWAIHEGATRFHLWFTEGRYQPESGISDGVDKKFGIQSKTSTTWCWNVEMLK